MMNPQEQSPRRNRKSGKFPFYIIILLLLASSAAALTWFYKMGDREFTTTIDIPVEKTVEAGSQADLANPAIPLTTKPPKALSTSQQDSIVTPSPRIDQTEDTLNQTTPAEKNIAANTNQAETIELTVEPLSTVDQCSQSATIVKDFFSHLDEREYMQNFLGENTSEPYFINLIQKLADNPPVVSRETDDLFTLLKNTAHFFRILGSDNITILKAILHEEQPQVENVLAHFYTLSLINGCAEQEFQLNLPKDALYDYAGFFLHTMGGRLYLFRRDSASRLSVSYYSILLIENANREGRNLHGIDIKPPLKLLIPEIENSGTQLSMRDTYLQKLYELENRLF